MSEIADRFRRVAAQFSERVDAVPADAWDSPAPCEGWVARDIVRHLAGWMPDLFLRNYDVEFANAASADDDPAAAWAGVRDAVQAALDDDALAGREREAGPGKFRLDQAVDMFGTPDVLIHTWDLARAAGLDEALDAEAVERTLAAMASIDEGALRSSGHFGPRVEVPDTAAAQDKLIAFTGRHP